MATVSIGYKQAKQAFLVYPRNSGMLCLLPRMKILQYDPTIAHVFDVLVLLDDDLSANG